MKTNLLKARFITKVFDWIVQHESVEVRLAALRMYRAEFVKAGERDGIMVLPDSIWQLLIPGPLDEKPGDAEIVGAAITRIPSGLISQFFSRQELIDLSKQFQSK